MRKRALGRVRVVVIKAGTSILTSKESCLDTPQIRKIVAQILSLVNQGIKVILVTSGAIASGMGRLKLHTRPDVLPKLQAAAAVGQSELMKLYDSLFRKGRHTVAQILLTADDFSDRKRYLNAKNTLLTLLKFGVVPIINENDAVSVDEIKFGDNDKLSAQVANLIGADLLIILSDIDGLYAQKGTSSRKSKVRIATVDRITSEIESLAEGTPKKTSVGGMITKIEAARITTSSGIPCIIANGKREKVISKIIKGEDVGTLFLSHTCARKGSNRLVAKKCWLAFTSQSRGKIVVDQGARDALVEKGKSLLPSGVIGLEGRFKTGDVVSVISQKGEEFARGMSNYSILELEKIKGCQTRTIASLLGYKYYDEVIHRDNLVIL